MDPLLLDAPLTPASETNGMFSQIRPPPSDPLYEAMARYSADQRPYKCDLGVGVFRDANGRSPVLAAVRAAEEELAHSEQTKAYFPLAGNPQFLDLLKALLFPGDAVRTAVIQSAGGTGALRLAFELIKLAKCDSTVHLGEPSWPSHSGLAAAVGLAIRPYPYLDRRSGAVDFDAMLAAARSCAVNDVFLLHGPCHNPSGIDLEPQQRDALLNLIARRGAVPIIDVAYWGLGDGIGPDLARLSEDVALVEQAFVAVSCSKAFGLYRERTGALFAFTRPGDERSAVQGNLEVLSRHLVSGAPAHGAAVVAKILNDEKLTQVWMSEMSDMRARIASIRTRLEGLSGHAPQLSGVSQGRGLFSLLPVSPSQVQYLSSEHAIHLPASGRINLTGLKPGDPERLAEALHAVSS